MEMPFSRKKQVKLMVSRCINECEDERKRVVN